MIKADNKSIVSIIVPVYNCEAFLEDCLGSLVGQTFTNFEVIVIDDGSTDRSKEIILDYSQKDGRILYLEQENSGPSEARNKGVKAASGQYITFVDADDSVSPDYIEKLYNAIVTENCDISICSVFRSGKGKNKYRLKYNKNKIYSSLEEKIKICDVPNCCYVWGKMYKREVVENLEFKKGVFFEDVLWLPKALKNSGNLATVSDCVYYYRINKNSIVRTIPNKKKQNDSYNSKKFIVKFFRENNLSLPEHERNITKSARYLFGIPVLKLKEKEFTNIWYLFGLIPLLKFTDYNSHYIFKLFNIKIKIRHKETFPYIEAHEKGVTDTKRSPEIIVSLTSFPARIQYVHRTINTLLRQTVKPDRVILWLAEEEFPDKEESLPENLLKLKNLGFEIRWCKNLLSYKKIVPALQEFPNEIIVTADDDIYYPEDWLESLYNEYLKNSHNVYVKQAIPLKIENNELRETYDKNKRIEVNVTGLSYFNLIMSGSGCLIPPHSLYKDIFDSNKFLSLIPTHDDIYIWAMMVLNKTKIKVVGGFAEEILTINETQKFGLCKINNKKGAGLHPQDALEIMTKAYPELLKLKD